MLLPQTYTASAVRADIYNLLDQVIETGEPLEIERKGHILRIVRERTDSWVDRLVPHEGVVSGDPDDLVSIDWSQHWNPGPL